MRRNIISGLAVLIPSLGLLASLPVAAQDKAAATDTAPLAEIALSNDTLQLRYYDKKDSDATSY
jgi:hypothetical protein